MLRNLALGLASIVLFFGLLEAALRLSGRVPTDAVRSPDLETLDSIPGLFEPGLDFVDRILPDLPYRVRINALGFRGEEFSAAKPPGTLRILCLGDSYTFGPYVEDHEAFPAALERILKERASPSAPKPEVINAGANGFTIVDELEFLKRKALMLDPDVVIVAFTQNDLTDLGRPRPQIEVMREHAKVKSMFVVGPIVKLLQRTALFNGMQRGAAWLKLRGRESPSALPAESESLLWSHYRALLGETATLLRDRHVRLLLLAWPSARQMEGADSLAPLGTLASYASELGIDHLDLRGALADLESRGGKAYLTPKDGHPSATGYAAAAEAVASELARLGIAAREEGRER